MNELLQTRRNFLKISAALGGMLVAVRLDGRAAFAANEVFEPNAFIRIDAAGPITLIVPHTEVGQGIYTSSAMLVCEELEVGLDQIQIEAAPPDLKKYMDPNLFDQATGGSLSTRSDWVRLREAGATARVLLISAAAARWSAPVEECSVERGVVSHKGTGRTASYGDLAGEAALLPAPAKPKLKEPTDFKIIGKTQKRIDTPAKVNGQAKYGIDVNMPGMKISTLAISPVKGGKLVSYDDAAARAVPGVVEVVRSGDDLIAVTAEHMWAAMRGLEALDPRWEAGQNSGLSSASHLSDLQKASDQSGVVARHEGDAAKAIETAETKLSAVYESPFLSHAPMEPLNCALHVRKDGADVWTGTQVPVRAQKAVADATGLPPEKVAVHNMLMGGAFGRKLEADMVFVAARLAKEVAYPVKFVWSREQDMTHDFYRPYYYDKVSAGLDKNGRLIGRTHRVTGPSILARFAPPAFKDGLDGDAVECAAETPYEESAVLVDYVRHEQDGINTSWWRGVGPTHNGFVVESFIDEMAAAAKQDPLEFRRSMLPKGGRSAGVLEAVVARADWKRPLPKGVGRGLSVLNAFGSYVALYVEVEVSKELDVTLKRVVAGIDCGMTINPDTVIAQMQGGIVFGLSAAMFSEITLTAGAVDQTNFDNYRVLRMNEMPTMEIIRIESAESPGGVGEAGTAAAAPALTNAIYSACGRRLRALPVTRYLATTT